MRLPAVLLLAALLCASATARAQAPAPTAAPVDLELQWTAPEGCPDGPAVLARVAHLLDRAVHAAGDGGLRAQGDVAQARDGTWQLRLAIATPDGSEERTLASESCARLGDVAALILAVTADPGGLSSRPPEAPTTATTATPTTPAPAVRLLPAHRGPEVGGLLRLTAAGDVGTLPAVSGLFGLALGVRVGRWRIEGAGNVGTPVAIAGTSAGTGSHMWLAAAGTLRGCVDPWAGRFDLGFCVGAEAGMMQGDGDGSLLTRTQGQGVWVAALGGVTGAWNLTRVVALRAMVEAGTPLAWPTFYLGGCDTPCEFSPYRAFVRASLGFELHFP